MNLILSNIHSNLFCMLIRIAEARRFAEVILMSTHNIGFYEAAKVSLNYHKILSNTHIISFSVISMLLNITHDSQKYSNYLFA